VVFSALCLPLLTKSYRCNPFGCTDGLGERCVHRQLNDDGNCDLTRDECPPDAIELKPCGPNSNQVDSDSEGSAHPCITSKLRAKAMCKQINMTPLILHVPKTGGKSLKRLWNNLIERNWWMQHFYHHGEKGYHTVLKDEALRNQQDAGCPLHLFTIIRNPVSRVISEWFHYGQTLLSRLPEETRASADGATEAIASTLSDIEQNPKDAFPGFGCLVLDETTQRSQFNNKSVMMEWLRAYANHPTTQNTQVKLLSGSAIFQNTSVSQSDVDELISMMRCRIEAGCLKDPESTQKNCAGKPVMFAGILEHWDRLIVRLGKQGESWRAETWGHVSHRYSIDYQMRKMTGYVEKEKIPEDILQEIRKANALDQELYDAALELDEQDHNCFLSNMKEEKRNVVGMMEEGPEKEAALKALAEAEAREKGTEEVAGEVALDQKATEEKRKADL